MKTRYLSIFYVILTCILASYVYYDYLQYKSVPIIEKNVSADDIVDEIKNLDSENDSYWEEE
jgi:hypothetical protein